MVDKINTTPGKNRRSFKAKRSSLSEESNDDLKKTNTSMVGNNTNTPNPKKQKNLSNQDMNVQKTPQQTKNLATPGSKKNKRKSNQNSLDNSPLFNVNNKSLAEGEPASAKKQKGQGGNQIPQQSAQNSTPGSKKNKRKSNQHSLNDTNSNIQTSPDDQTQSSTKKQKLQKFSGVNTLDASKQTPKADKGKNKNTNPLIKDAKFKQRHEKNVARRKARRIKYKQAEAALKSGESVSEEFMQDIAKQIETIIKRPEKTTTAKKRLRYLYKLQRLATGQDSKSDTQKIPQQNQQQKQAKKQENKKQKQNKEPAKKILKNAEPVQQESEDEDEDESESEAESSDYDAEATIKVDKVTKKMNETEDGDEDAEEDDDEDAEEEEDDEEEDDEENAEDDDSEEEDEDSTEESEELPAKKVVPQKKNENKKGKPNAETPDKGKSRYVVFVGNLPYDADKNDIMEHFKKVGDIQDVRLPLDSKTNKARGFAYLELKNEQSYQVKILL